MKFLDVGCCTGTDIRMMISQGLATPENIRGIDLEQGFIDLGFDLFEDRDRLQKCFTVGTILGDGLPYEKEEFDVIYCGSVFHLFNEEDGIKLAQNILPCLKKGGILYGRTVGSSKDEPFEGDMGPRSQLRWMHTPTSLDAMLVKVGFATSESQSASLDMPGIANGSRQMIAFTATKAT
eukprot:TRINITY_DN7354_c0_g1_i2.p2 TRINITY_DN7354_c0_g1~~TRINITY_DN7354_c0_g1_i2.p2  ORF type:complete len:179 (+),score=35.19 TRINITY_DN7354_c0_g1_i2:323-859(+)